jgi:hypothetical protein
MADPREEEEAMKDVCDGCECEFDEDRSEPIDFAVGPDAVAQLCTDCAENAQGNRTRQRELYKKVG